MINIQNRRECCGCAACVQRCPKQCITMQTDKEGFLYPKVDKEKCIDCGLCEKVCPIINHGEKRTPLAVYAAKNTNEEVRLKSSSGGVFTLLAEPVINGGGVVFGARFNEEWDVVHSYTETIEGLAAFRGSKYLQSNIGDSYKKAEMLLKSGRKVLFSGTPCQIAGLRCYLRKEYENLLTVECVCHGVPSPKVWREYLKEVKANSRATSIQDVCFRDKSTGWKGYSVSYKCKGKQDVYKRYSAQYYDNPFMRAFLGDFILRPSCYSCVAKAGSSGADIALADFWGIEKILPHFDDDWGCNLLIDYSGRVSYENGCELLAASYEDAVKYNPAVVCSVYKPLNRDFFFFRLNKGRGCIGALDDTMSSAVLMRIYRMIYRKFFI